jgi:hypothetical protein
MKIRELLGESSLYEISRRGGYAAANILDKGRPSNPVEESTGSASTGAGSIATLVGGAGGPMMKVIRRMPAGQSFFGPAGTAAAVKPRKKNKKPK